MDCPTLTDPSGIDICSFLQRFSLAWKPLLDALKVAGAIVTGADFVLLMAGRWDDSLRARPRALVLDVLYHGRRARVVLEQFLAAAGYRRSRFACRHALGEWSAVPTGKRTCMVRGEPCCAGCASGRVASAACRLRVEPCVRQHGGSLPNRDGIGRLAVSAPDLCPAPVLGAFFVVSRASAGCRVQVCRLVGV
jgi:hypothetical protein